MQVCYREVIATFHVAILSHSLSPHCIRRLLFLPPLGPVEKRAGNIQITKSPQENVGEIGKSRQENVVKMPKSPQENVKKIGESPQ